MNIPASIRITHKITYQIAWTDLINGDPLVQGTCDPNTRMILIKNGQSDKEAFSTFIHEVYHAMSFEADIILTEKQVIKLEKATMRVLKLNKLLTF